MLNKSDPDLRVRRTRKIVACTVAVLLGVGAGIAGLSVANAASNAPRNSDVEESASHDGVAETPATVSQAGVDVAWRQAVSDVTLKLPGDGKFPEQAPDFFRATEGSEVIYEAALFEHFVHNYWRCAWLDEDIQASKAGRASAADLDGVNATYRESLPAESREEFDGYTSAVEEMAKSSRTSTAENFFEFDCVGLYEAGRG